MTQLRTTNLTDTLYSIKQRKKDVVIMLDLAERSNDNSGLQTVLTKAAFMMLCSHFEGAFFDVMRAVLRDTNDAAMYNKLPMELRKQHVQNSLLRNIKSLVSKNALENAAEAICDKFESQQVKIDIEEDFLNTASNLTPDVVNTFCCYFGVEEITRGLRGTSFEQVFEGDDSVSSQFIKKEFSILVKESSTFPYSFNKKRHSLTAVKKREALFNDFLIDLIYQRNQFMHGTISNQRDIGIREIKEDMLKIQSLILAEIYYIGGSISESVTFQGPRVRPKRKKKCSKCDKADET